MIIVNLFKHPRSVGRYLDLKLESVVSLIPNMGFHASAPVRGHYRCQPLYQQRQQAKQELFTKCLRAPALLRTLAVVPTWLLRAPLDK